MGNKILVPLCGVDESMTGFSINGWEIKKLDPTCVSKTIIDEMSDTDVYKQIRLLLDTEDVFSALPFINDIQNPCYFVFVKETDDISDIGAIIDVLRLIKSSKFGCWMPVTLKHGHILPVEKGHSYTSNAIEMRDLLSLSEDEQSRVSLLLHNREKQLYPSSINTMLSFFHDSCRSMNLFLSFVTRITVLEILIDGNAELSYRLKHHVAVLLGRNKNESIEIADNLKKAYTARSKFLHEGESKIVTEEMMKIAFEYSRRVIANLLCVSDDMRIIRITLEQAGYGDNPYNAIF